MPRDAPLRVPMPPLHASDCGLCQWGRGYPGSSTAGHAYRLARHCRVGPATPRGHPAPGILLINPVHFAYAIDWHRSGFVIRMVRPLPGVAAERFGEIKVYENEGRLKKVVTSLSTEKRSSTGEQRRPETGSFLGRNPYLRPKMNELLLNRSTGKVCI